MAEIVDESAKIGRTIGTSEFLVDGTLKYLRLKLDSEDTDQGVPRYIGFSLLKGKPELKMFVEQGGSESDRLKQIFSTIVPITSRIPSLPLVSKGGVATAEADKSPAAIAFMAQTTVGSFVVLPMFPCGQPNPSGKIKTTTNRCIIEMIGQKYDMNKLRAVPTRGFKVIRLAYTIISELYNKDDLKTTILSHKDPSVLFAACRLLDSCGYALAKTKSARMSLNWRCMLALDANVGEIKKLYDAANGSADQKRKLNAKRWEMDVHEVWNRVFTQIKDHKAIVVRRKNKPVQMTQVEGIAEFLADAAKAKTAIVK